MATRRFDDVLAEHIAVERRELTMPVDDLGKLGVGCRHVGILQRRARPADVSVPGSCRGNIR